MSGKRKIRRRRRVLFIFVSIGIGLLGAFLCAETALRIYTASRGWTPNCYATGLVFFVPNERSGHTMRPGLRLKSSTYDISVNSIGLRGPEIRREGEHSRIAVLGGSSVFGYLVPEGKDSCRQLESFLKEQDINCEVLNAGVPGFNLLQVRHRYEELIAPLEPDLVILYLGWNDIPFLIGSPSHERTPPAPNLMQRVLSKSVLYGFLRFRVFPNAAPKFAPPADSNTRVTQAGEKAFRSEFLKLLEAIRQSGATPVISTQLMAAAEECKDLESFLGSTQEQIKVNQELGAWVLNKERSIAAEQEILLIDCAAELSCNADLLGDAIHLTSEGHEEVAQLWAQALAPMLRMVPVDDSK